jgi:hypothetical protein
MISNRMLIDIPFVLNVFVDSGSNANGNQCVIPAGDEHESNAQADSKERQRPKDHHIHESNVMLQESSSPMVEAEAGSPVGRFQDGLQAAGKIDEAIAHEEEPSSKE